MSKPDVSNNESGLPVLTSVASMLPLIRRVFFHPEHLEAAVIQWGHLLEEHPQWHHPCHYFDGSEKTVRWIFVLNVLNHCFWPDRDRPAWAVTYGGADYSGYWGLAASLKRAMDNGVPVTDAAYLSRLPAEDLRDVFSGEGEIPLFEERLNNLREAGRIVESHWSGDIVNLVESARESAVLAVRKIIASFPSFRDQAEYGGSTVYFWKRAQLFASDLHLAFDGKKWGRFHDIEELTAFADYKLPQVLRELGVILYRADLGQRIDRMDLLEPGGEEEVEIRSMTIHAVEALREAFARAGKPVASSRVDNWLWQLGQLEPFRRRPYHRCRTIYY